MFNTTDVVDSSVVGIEEERRVDMEVVESILPIVSETFGVVNSSVVVSIVASEFPSNSDGRGRVVPFTQ